MTAAENTNAEKAVEIGKKILDRMVGESLKEHSFKRKDKAVIMTVKQKIGEKSTVSSNCVRNTEYGPRIFT